MTRKPASPDHSVRGVAHDYWIERRERRLAARKPMRKRTSKKEFDKPIDLWDKVI